MSYNLRDQYLGIGISGYGTDCRGIGGYIKERPEDFVVAEVLKEEARRNVCPKGEGYPLYIMSKRNKDVLSAKKSLELSVKSKVNILGLKDKRAVTYQFASCRSRKASRSNLVEGDIKGIHVVDTSRPLTRSDLLGNAFNIRISKCKTDCEILPSIIQSINNHKIPNFFGMQRFGVARPNHVVGKYIVKREFEKAAFYACGSDDEPLSALRRIPLKVRRLYVSAFQSYLFNRCLSRMLEEGGLPIAVKNGVLMNFDRNVPRVEEGFVTQVTESPGKGFVQMCPIPGYSFRQRDNPYWKAMNDVMDEEGVSAKDFFVKEMQEVSAEGGLRPASMIGWIKGWSVEDGIRIRFILYKGEFATILLREVMKRESPIEFKNALES